MLPLLIADRYDHQREISEKLYGELPHVVVCDRYVLSTMAYQFTSVGPERMDMELCRRLHGLDKIIPPTTIFLDVDIQEAERRVASRGVPKQLYERRLKSIAAGYQTILENRLDEAFGLNQRIYVVNGHGSVEDVAERIDDVVFDLLGLS
jgi:thymidylate kinase